MQDINSAMYVLIHEAAHVVNLTVGHDKTFWQTMSFMLDKAIELGLYKENFSDKKPFCNQDIAMGRIHAK